MTRPRPETIKVFMLTYDHGPYIRQAIESALMQQVDIPVTLVIGEDQSTDDTRSIVMEMAERYPDRIKPILHEKRLGVSRTGYDVWEECLRDSTYVAVLDGDDFWTDTHKLQKQVDLLRTHPDVSMCFNNAWNLMPDGSRTDYVRAWLGQEEVRSRYDERDIIARNFIPSVGVMFRNASGLRLMERLEGFPVLDYTISVVLSQQGRLAFIDEVMGVRRLHTGGMMSMRSLQYKTQYNLDLLVQLDRLSGYRHSDLLAKRRRQLLDDGFQAALAAKDLSMARKRWRQMARWASTSRYSPYTLLHRFALSHLPGPSRWWARWRTTHGT